MRIIDISLAVSPGMLVWPGNPAVSVEPVQRISRGDAANVSSLTLGTHTGTHVDPPVHFLDGGATAESLPLDVLVGPAYVAALDDHGGPLSFGDLDRAGVPDDVERLLLRTSNSRLWHAPAPLAFPGVYACLAPDAARWIIDRGISLVGVDFLSVEARGTPGHPTHVALLEAGVVVVEGLDLSEAAPGRYLLACLPLKIAGGDGAPARAVLVDGI